MPVLFFLYFFITFPEKVLIFMKIYVILKSRRGRGKNSENKERQVSEP